MKHLRIILTKHWNRYPQVIMICNTISEFERYIPLAIIHASFVVISDTIIIAGNLLIIVRRKALHEESF